MSGMLGGDIFTWTTIDRFKERPVDLARILDENRKLLNMDLSSTSQEEPLKPFPSR